MIVWMCHCSLIQQTGKSHCIGCGGESKPQTEESSLTSPNTRNALRQIEEIASCFDPDT